MSPTLQIAVYIRNNSVANFCEECVLWRVFGFHLTVPHASSESSWVRHNVLVWEWDWWRGPLPQGLPEVWLIFAARVESEWETKLNDSGMRWCQHFPWSRIFQYSRHRNRTLNESEVVNRHTDNWQKNKVLYLGSSRAAEYWLYAKVAAPGDWKQLNDTDKSSVQGRRPRLINQLLTDHSPRAPHGNIGQRHQSSDPDPKILFNAVEAT